MGCGTNLMKVVMLILNAIVWILGIVMLVIGIVVLVESDNWDEMLNNKTVPVSVLLLVVGILIAIIGFLGCCGAMKQNNAMLVIYAIMLSIIIIIQLVAAILAFVFSDKAEDIVDAGVDKALKAYGDSESYTSGLDWVQEYFECCGKSSYTDWKSSSGVATNWIKTHTNDVPDSCCKTVADDCGVGLASGTSDDIWGTGCLSTAKEFMYDRGIMMGIIGIVFLVVEAFGVIFALCLRQREVVA